MSTEQFKDFIKDVLVEAEEAQKNATLHTETQVINFKPKWTSEITQESLNKHIDFINTQGAILTAATSNIAFEKYPETKSETWTGIMDFGGLTITSQNNMREEYSMGEDKKEFGYGINDLIFDLEGSNGEAIDAFYTHFSEIDHERCKNLFEEK